MCSPYYGEHMFGRIVLVLLVLAVAVAVVARPSSGSSPERVYVVKPTDTLWSIAARHYAGDPREGVWELQERNDLTGTLLRPGQRLVLPAS
jgi:LysM repeat protein